MALVDTTRREESKGMIATMSMSSMNKLGVHDVATELWFLRVCILKTMRVYKLLIEF